MIFYLPDFIENSLTEKQSDTLLIIPVINEGERIQRQIQDLSNISFKTDIVIVDGGSTDGSLGNFSFFKSLGVNAILTKVGPGKLSAQLQIGFHYGLQNYYKYMITMDGNGKDGPEGIEIISRYLFRGYDFVQGSRFVSGGIASNTPKIRDFAIRIIHAPLTSIAAGHHFTDTTNGFRGFSRQLLQSDDMAVFRNVFNSYELIFYIPIRASRLGFRVCEAPVRREYPNVGPTPTKIHGMRSYFNLLKILLAACLGKYNP